VTHDQAEAMTLADRIVVMNQGTIQQIGAPDDIYHRPANLFVATFLGTPQMNLIEGMLGWSAGRPVFTRDGLVLRLRDMPGLAHTGAERPVVLGIRPEDVVLAAPETLDEPQLACEVVMVSSLGSEKYINTAVAGRDLTFRVGKDVAVAPGDRLKLTIPGARVHLFDRGTGAALGNA
jgi:multiple sugar transport system ATP-binding protein